MGFLVEQGISEKTAKYIIELIDGHLQMDEDIKDYKIDMGEEYGKNN